MRNLIFGLSLGVLSTLAIAQRPPDPFPDAVTADPEHYSVSFENDVVRVLRVRYEPGDRSVMHRHWASCVVFLTDQTFDFMLADGTTAPASVPEGALGCGDGNVHRPENIGPEAAEFIMLELKGRDTFQ